jgi:transposase
VERHELETLIADGRSLEEIGRLYGRHPSTVGYWLNKFGLRAAHSDRCGRRGPLDRELLVELIGKGLTEREIAEETCRSCSTVRHWLKRYGLRTHRAREAQTPGPKPRRTRRRCLRHGPATFILENRGYYRCLKCRAERVAERRRRVKAILVEEAGGRCVACGYSRYVGALQFHHVDPDAKAFALSRAGVTRSIARAREEASKCVLLCANCHAEIEGGVATLCDRQQQ